MDPADKDQEPGLAQVRATVTQQGILLGQHNANIRALVEANQMLTNQVSSLASQLTSLLASQISASPPEPEASPPRDIHSAPPEPFSGQPHLCRGFLFHCGLQFQLQPVSFTTDIAKIQYIMGLLRGKALTWARSQGRRSVEEYTLEFRTLPAEVDWTQDSLRAAYVNGLSEQMKDELVSRDDPQELNDLITLALRIDAFDSRPAVRSNARVPSLQRLTSSPPSPSGLPPTPPRMHPRQPPEMNPCRWEEPD
ncbi:hypothetical protein L3Q82_013698 [Scortum barcoo]|uniref:Uncharacterized protein n=1 Tax=Scortum barcoo TaxID=214431 RepID=A0ACB8W0Q1_9TELE|nr:hypothetical protein L3Q82_013698 [Scortum barcoo]